MKVLVAIDESDYSLDAVRAVACRPWPEDVEFCVFSVVEPFMPEDARWQMKVDKNLADVEKDLVSKSEKVVGKRVKLLKEAFPERPVSGEVVLGHVRATIIDKAEKWPADLVVLGSHGRTGVKKFLLGSVAEDVVTRAPCCVEVVRRPLHSGQSGAKN